MVKTKNTLNLKSNNTSKKSISSRLQVDGIVKKEITMKKEEPISKSVSSLKMANEMTRKENPNKKDYVTIKKEIIKETEDIKSETEDSSIDSNRRLFLKIAGVAGLGLAASTLFPNDTNAYVSGSTPTSNVVGMKNIANAKINPATEDTLATLAKETTLTSIKNQSDKLTFDGSNNLLTKGSVSVSNVANTPINPATEESLVNVGQSVNDQSIWMLRKIITLLKPLGMTTGAGSNRLSVDVNSGTVAISSGTVTTVSTVTTVATLTNLTNIGNVNSFSLMKDSARNAYSNSIRANLSF